MKRDHNTHEPAVRAELQAEISRREFDRTDSMRALIDPQTNPYSPIADIKTEIEEIRKLPPCPERDYIIAEMQSWIDEQDPIASPGKGRSN